MKHSANSSQSSAWKSNPNPDLGKLLSIEHWTFPCTYCSKSFSSPQALGGHQNAHRKQRKEERRYFPFDYPKGSLLTPLLTKPEAKPTVILKDLSLWTLNPEDTSRPSLAYDPPSHEPTLTLGHGPCRCRYHNAGEGSSTGGLGAGYGSIPYGRAHGNYNLKNNSYPERLMLGAHKPIPSISHKGRGHTVLGAPNGTHHKHVNGKPKLGLDENLTPVRELAADVGGTGFVVSSEANVQAVKGSQTLNEAEEGNNSQTLDLTLKL